MKSETIIDASNLFYAVIEGEDEKGNPVYGEPKKLFENEQGEEI